VTYQPPEFELPSFSRSLGYKIPKLGHVAPFTTRFVLIFIVSIMLLEYSRSVRTKGTSSRFEIFVVKIGSALREKLL